MFQVFDLEFFDQLNAVSGLFQPIAEIDILDGGPLIPLIKSAHCHEDLTANGTATTPKGRRFLFCRLVNVVMEQILVLGQEIALEGLLVVGAEKGGYIGAALEGVKNAADGVLGDGHVGIEEKKGYRFLLCLHPNCVHGRVPAGWEFSTPGRQTPLPRARSRRCRRLTPQLSLQEHKPKPPNSADTF